jgi:hypothetical protein
MLKFYIVVFSTSIGYPNPTLLFAPNVPPKFGCPLPFTTTLVRFGCTNSGTTPITVVWVVSIKHVTLFWCIAPYWCPDSFATKLYIVAFNCEMLWTFMLHASNTFSNCSHMVDCFVSVLAIWDERIVEFPPCYIPHHSSIWIKTSWQ